MNQGQLIMDYGKNPTNYGKLPNPDVTYTEENHTCGEKCTVYISFKDADKNKRVEEITFEAEGRIILIASGSLLTEEIEDKNLKEILNYRKEDILELLEVETLTPKRLKSALLPLLTLQNAYNKINQKEQTSFEELLNQ